MGLCFYVRSILELPISACVLSKAKSLIIVPKVGAIWLFSSGTANSVYRFIRYQHNGSGRFSQVFYCLLSALLI